MSKHFNNTLLPWFSHFSGSLFQKVLGLQVPLSFLLSVPVTFQEKVESSYLNRFYEVKEIYFINQSSCLFVNGSPVAGIRRNMELSGLALANRHC